MQITLSSTSRIVEINGVPARIWEGKTSGGIPVICAVTSLAAANTADRSEMERDLKEHAPPSDAATACFSLRMVL